MVRECAHDSQNFREAANTHLIFVLHLFQTIPRAKLMVVAAQLDAFCKRTNKSRKTATSGTSRFFWTRRGATITIAEEKAGKRGGLVRRDSGRFVYKKGAWHLYYLNATDRWLRYPLAAAEDSFSVVFAHWRADATGIFQSPKVRRSIEAEIERDAFARLLAP